MAILLHDACIRAGMRSAPADPKLPGHFRALRTSCGYDAIPALAAPAIATGIGDDNSTGPASCAT